MPEATEADQKIFLTIPEAGAVLGVGRARAYALAAQGLIPTIRLSERRLLVPRRALEALSEAAVERARQIGAGFSPARR